MLGMQGLVVPSTSAPSSRIELMSSVRVALHVRRQLDEFSSFESSTMSTTFGFDRRHLQLDRATEAGVPGTGLLKTRSRVEYMSF
jgi:hypothetical protein